MVRNGIFTIRHKHSNQSFHDKLDIQIYYLGKMNFPPLLSRFRKTASDEISGAASLQKCTNINNPSLAMITKKLKCTNNKL